MVVITHISPIYTLTHHHPPLCSSALASAKSCGFRVNPPPLDFDFRAETKPQTLAIVQDLYPQLLDLAEDGTLVAVRRRSDYLERRSDGYVEPEVVFLVGTSHISTVSASQVTRVVNAVHPENVVVELCRSRAGMMYDVSPKGGIGENDKAQWKKQEPNLMSIGGDNFVTAIRRSLDLGGRSALFLRLLLAGMSQRLSDSVGIASGEEVSP